MTFISMNVDINIHGNKSHYYSRISNKFNKNRIKKKKKKKKIYRI